MYNYRAYMFCFLVVSWFMLSITTAFADNPPENREIARPDYDNVDVFVEYEWGGSDKINHVSVFDRTQSKEPHLTIKKVVMKKIKWCEICLVKGVMVKIFNHDTHELLKTYKGGK